MRVITRGGGVGWKMTLAPGPRGPQAASNASRPRRGTATGDGNWKSRWRRSSVRRAGSQEGILCYARSGAKTMAPPAVLIKAEQGYWVSFVLSGASVVFIERGPDLKRILGLTIQLAKVKRDDPGTSLFFSSISTIAKFNNNLIWHTFFFLRVTGM